jgi:cytochrome c
MDTTRAKSPTRKTRSPLSRRAAFMLSLGGLVGAATPTMASASQVKNLKAVGPQGQVLAIRHNGRKFQITTADGRSIVFQAVDLRFKIDVSDDGPSFGKPVILPGGMKGDRATIFFASPAEIGALIKEES